MKIKKVILENFRGYKNHTEIDFDNLTFLIGKNDIGKSTILTAIDIFFENRKIDFTDRNILCEQNDKILIGIVFCDLPSKIILDSEIDTDFESEYLLNSEGFLEIHKHYEFNNRIQTQILIKALYPTNEKVGNLLALKIKDLQKIAQNKELNIDKNEYDGRTSSEIRKAIYKSQCNNLNLQEQFLQIEGAEIKNIWSKIVEYFPLFFIFHSDRENSDKDNEIQDPLKFATRQVLAKPEMKQILEEVKKQVYEEVKIVAERTEQKVKEMNEEIEATLTPEFLSETWEKAFNISFSSNGIPLNNRGSGVKRLYLINFLRAQAEELRNRNNNTNIIYAIEEPETSLHPDWQKKLIETFTKLSESGYQIIITTHSPYLASLIKIENIRFIHKSNSNVIVSKDDEDIIEKVASTLGIFPDLEGIKNDFGYDLKQTNVLNDLKLIVCVEGPTDYVFFCNIGNLFNVDFKEDKRVLLVYVGGATLKHFINFNVFKKLNKPEIHIYDKDTDEKYKNYVKKVNERTNRSWATLTEKRELENYVHPKLIKSQFKLNVDIIDLTLADWLKDWNKLDVEKELEKKGRKNTKNSIAEDIAPKMTKKLFKEIGALDELENKWFKKIKELIND